MPAPASEPALPPELREPAALVALLRGGGGPASRYAELVEEAGSAVAVLEQELGLTLEGPQRMQALIVEAHTAIKQWRAQGIRLLTVLDPAYPRNLRTVHDRPALLFLAGELQAQDARSVAIVGPRDASAKSQDNAHRLAAHLADIGFTIVSGLAAGIDTAAHRGALSIEGGRTLAVIGTGIKRTYPPQNAQLQAEIARCGAVVSRFWPDAPPTRYSFPMRNVVISGLALATVIVDTEEAGGTKIQARLALRQARPILLLPAALEQRWGRELAQKPGTQVVRRPDEVADILSRLAAPGSLVS